MDMHMNELQNPIVRRLAQAEETVWINPKKVSYREASGKIALSGADIADASERLRRFAPLIMELFPETSARGGIIESDLTEIPAMKAFLAAVHGADLGGGRLFLKRDSDLAVAGSVKARGGIYEVLKHSETLALEAGILTGYDDDYTKLLREDARAFFAKRKVQVGSTGNLGMSIGIVSAALGYHAIVHMSADAKSWKKDLLRARGVTVVEYEGDYSRAVEKGRAESENDALSYFVDDENSKDLFLGYSVAAERLAGQLEAQEVVVDGQHPLFVYLPCGVGGAPGGIAFGLKEQFGDDVHVFFAEPVQACCMLLGLATGLHNGICVQDIGLTGVTQADGLAVGRPSGFVGKMAEFFISGEVTVEDSRLFEYLRGLWSSEGIFIEPSACAAFAGVTAFRAPEMQEYIVKNGLADKMDRASHIVWATGGMLVPQQVREQYLKGDSALRF